MLCRAWGWFPVKRRHLRSDLNEEEAQMQRAEGKSPEGEIALYIGFLLLL